MHQNPAPANTYATTHHTAATSGTRFTLRNLGNTPYSRSDCWRASCRAAWSPFLPIRIFLGTAEPVVNAPIYVSAACHGEFLRPADLTDEARSWLWGGAE